MISDINYYKKVGKRLITFLFTLIILYIAFKLSVFYSPFLIAFIISLIIEPLIRKVMKITNLTRKASAILTLIIVFSIIIALLIWGITSLITETTVILDNLNDSAENIVNKVTELITNFDFDNIKLPNQIKDIIQNTFNNMVGKGSDIAQKVLTSIMNMVTNIPKILIYIAITIIATYFVCADKMYLLDQLEHHLPRNWINKFGVKLRKVISSLGDYLKAEGVIILISFFIVLVGLLVFNIVGMNVKYPLIIAIFIGFVDALPILGSGTVLVPWAVITAFNGDITLAISLIVLYVIVVVTRQLAEPKIVSNHIGIHPVFTLIAMYTGFKTIGVIGMFIGPIILIILNDVFETMIYNGLVKTILDRK